EFSIFELAARQLPCFNDVCISPTMRWSQAEWTRPLARPDAPFRRVPGWSAAVRMIAVGYRYLSPVPGMSVEVRVPAERVWGAGGRGRRGGGGRGAGALSGGGLLGCTPPRGAPVSRFPSMPRRRWPGPDPPLVAPAGPGAACRDIGRLRHSGAAGLGRPAHAH